MTDHVHDVIADEETHFCEVHPDQQTELRCNRCNRYMCVQCAVQTPVGYTCKECIRGHDDKFYKGTDTDYIKVFVVAAVLTGLGALLLKQLSLPLIFLLLLGLPIGGAIGEAALRLTERRRGRHSDKLAAAGAAVGGLLGGIVSTYLTLQSIISQTGAAIDVPFDLVLSSVGSDLTLFVFIGMVAVAAYGRFQMKI